MSQSDNWLYDTRDFLKSEGLISCLHGNNFFQDQQMADVDMLELADKLYDSYSDFREVMTDEDDIDEDFHDDDDTIGEDDVDEEFDDDGWDDVEEEEEEVEEEEEEEVEEEEEEEVEEDDDWSDDEDWDDEDEVEDE